MKDFLNAVATRLAVAYKGIDYLSTYVENREAEDRKYKLSDVVEDNKISYEENTYAL